MAFGRAIVEDTAEARYLVETCGVYKMQYGIAFRRAETGYVTRMHRSSRAGAKVIQSIADEPNLDKACKMRILECIKHFMQ